MYYESLYPQAPELVGAEVLQAELAQRFSDKAVRVRHYQDAQPCCDASEPAHDVSGLVGIIALLVAASGGHISGIPKESLRPLPCSKSSERPRVNLAHLSSPNRAIGLLASCAGALFGAGLQFARRRSATVADMELEFHLMPMPLVEGLYGSPDHDAVRPLAAAGGAATAAESHFSKDVAAVSSRSPSLAVWVVIGAVTVRLPASPCGKLIRGRPQSFIARSPWRLGFCMCRLSVIRSS